jgi:hypothetical protein
MKKSALARRTSLLGTLLMLVVFLFSLGVFSPPKASASIPACGTGELRKTYYNDMAHTTIIGGWRWTCDCVVESWGETSGYNTQVILPCPP